MGRFLERYGNNASFFITPSLKVNKQRRIKVCKLTNVLQKTSHRLLPPKKKKECLVPFSQRTCGAIQYLHFIWQPIGENASVNTMSLSTFPLSLRPAALEATASPSNYYSRWQRCSLVIWFILSYTRNGLAAYKKCIARARADAAFVKALYIPLTSALCVLLQESTPSILVPVHTRLSTEIHSGE